jgi:parvulin-like peptidyl-prolyl isomerase
MPLRILILVSLLVLPGCRLLTNGEEAVIAEIDGQPVTRGDFESYVEGVLAVEGDQGSEAPSPELLSRLLDGYLEEELIIREATRRGIQVGERELTEALRGLRNPEVESQVQDVVEHRRLRDRMRRALMAEKFREERLLKGLSVSLEEVANYYEEHRDEFKQSARVVFRQILLDDPDEARKVRRELLKDPSRFREIAEEVSLAPDGGRARAYHEADLPPQIVEAVASVPEGQISKVATTDMGSRLFLVEKREPERDMGIDEAADGIRVVLLQEEGRRAYEDMMEALRQQTELVIREENMPFAYQKGSS